MKYFKSFVQVICKLRNWVKTEIRLSTAGLIITVIFLILTFQYAYRPYVGVTKCIWSYNKPSKDLIAEITIKNSGNIPANNVGTNIELFSNSRLLENIKGQSRWLLFQSQETSGSQTFHNVEIVNLNNDTMEVHLEITYELPINLIIHRWVRKFKTTQVLRYDHKSSKCQIISGEST